MPATEEPTLSLAEWLVLCLVCEKPQHGFAIARLLGANGDLGRIWRVPKPVVYRSLQRLEDAGLLQSTDPEPSTMGPLREPVRATARGRKLAAAWLTKPAGHARDVRSELLVKLAMLDRARRGWKPGWQVLPGSTGLWSCGGPKPSLPRCGSLMRCDPTLRNVRSGRRWRRDRGGRPDRSC
jgi:DNA-binding PadR family transcriptional regulator